MKKEFKIKEPCNVGRENMKEIEGGSFCDFCSKKVHNLTAKSDDEIKLILSSNTSICGRIQASRLYLTEEKQKLNYNFFQFPFRKITSGIFIAAMFSNSLFGQQKKNDTLGDKKIIEGIIVYAAGSDGEENHFKKTVFRKVNGWVKNGSNDKMANAEVNLFGLTVLHTASTNNQGNFNFQTTEDDAQKFSFLAIKTKDDPNKAFLFNLHQFDFDKIDINLKNTSGTEINPKKISKDAEYYFDGEKLSYNEFSDLITDDNATYFYVPYPFSNQLLSDDKQKGIYIGFTKD